MDEGGDGDGVFVGEEVGSCVRDECTSEGGERGRITSPVPFEKSG